MVSSENLQQLVLEHLRNENPIADSSLLKLGGNSVDSQDLLGVLKRLASHEMVEYTSTESEGFSITDEGRDILDHGSHEVKVFNLVSEAGTPTSEVQAKLGEMAKIGMGKAFQKGWIGQKDSQTLVRKVSSV